jgi:hypothetical protein
VTFSELRNSAHCVHAPEEGAAGARRGALAQSASDCKTFEDQRPSTVAMSVLVVVEMFNALNAISENGSLLSQPPWANLWLLGAIAVSMVLHFAILCVPTSHITCHVHLEVDCRCHNGVTTILSLLSRFTVCRYIPGLQAVFGATALSWREWRAVIVLSAPVVVLDEVLKMVSRGELRFIERLMRWAWSCICSRSCGRYAVFANSPTAAELSKLRNR